MTDFVQALQGYKQEKNIGVKQLAQLLGRDKERALFSLSRQALQLPQQPAFASPLPFSAASLSLAVASAWR